MAVTIQQIAEKTGVSRGTVDRALNNRGRVNKDVADYILKTAEEMGYAAKRRKKKRIKIGIVTRLANASFMIEVNRGIADARKELEKKNVEILLKEGITLDAKEQLDALNALDEEQIDALAIMPVESETIRTKLNEMIETKHIPVITLNSDIVGTKRLCYVGLDNQKSGAAAASLMGMMNKGNGCVLIVTGDFVNSVTNYRIDGFVNEMKKSYPELELIGVQGTYDSAEEVKKALINTIQGVSNEVTGVFMISRGQDGIQKAYKELALEKRPYTIIYDLTEKNRKLLEEDVVDFIIDQDSYRQGHLPPHLLAEYLWSGKLPEKEFYYTDIILKAKYNI